MKVAKLIHLLRFTNTEIEVKVSLPDGSGGTVEIDCDVDESGKFKEIPRFVLKASLPEGYLLLAPSRGDFPVIAPAILPPVGGAMLPGPEPTDPK